jgi:hypothetical protein
MVGMLQIIAWLLCAYLIFKGFEIFQIANVKSHEPGAHGMLLGTVMLVISFVLALVFFALINMQADAIGSSR